MRKYFLSKDNDGLYALVNGSHVIPRLRLIAANLEQHFSRKIISQVNKCEFLIRLSSWLSSIRQVFLSPFWIRSSKKLFQTGIKLVQRVSASGNVQLYNYALSIRLKELGPEHVDVAISCNNLSRVHHNQGNLSKARHYYNCSRAIFFEKAWTSSWPCSYGNFLQQPLSGAPPVSSVTWVECTTTRVT